jgi:hypothetical protein
MCFLLVETTLAAALSIDRRKVNTNIGQQARAQHDLCTTAFPHDFDQLFDVTETMNFSGDSQASLLSRETTVQWPW